MSGFARVTSIDALQTTAAAVQRFRAECSAALDELELATRRALGWIQHDRREHWACELRRSEEAVTQARVQLRQAQTMRRIDERPPACMDEERALKRAQRRQDIAQRKIEAVRHWTRAIDHAVDEYRRARVQFQMWLDGDLVKAVAVLNQMSDSLQNYASLEPPVENKGSS
jgi:hypothetical protein